MLISSQAQITILYHHIQTILQKKKKEEEEERREAEPCLMTCTYLSLLV